ncbi:MAG: hypothetical protein JWN96_1250 [Mycobacterium sp.]|jgi:hypothetical protein|nr:hypothetical protein [Mycobacterium sp.]
MSNAARALAQRLNNTAPKYDNVDDAAAIAFAKRLQERGIVGDVAGMLEGVDPADEQWKRVLQLLREEKKAAEEAERRTATS